MQEYFIQLSAVFTILAMALILFNWRRHRKPKIEFKCLEHMVALDRWDPQFGYWCCPIDGCEVVVDAETRLQYEGVKPPR